MNVPEIKSAIQTLAMHKDLRETIYVTLKQDGANLIAVVLAWCEGFEHADIDDDYHQGDCRICGKVARCDSAMREYLEDWDMPTDSNGDIFDTETSIENEHDIPNAIKFWEYCWGQIQDESMW